MSDRDFIGTVREVRGRVLRRQWANRLMKGFGLWLLFASAALSLDAAWSLVGAYFAEDAYVVYELPVWWRVLVSTLLGLGLIGVLSRFYLPRSFRDRPLAYYARLVEKQLKITDGRLVDAAQLIDRPSPGDLRTGLVDRVISHADAQVKGLDLRRIAPPQWVAPLAIAFFLMGMLVPLVPQVMWPVSRQVSQQSPIGRTIWRYVEPLADHPPASVVILFNALELPSFLPHQPHTTASGKYLIDTFAFGGAPDQVRIVIQWADGQQQTVAANAMRGVMTSYKHVVHDVDQPFRYAAFAANARTRWMTVTPNRYPIFEQLDLTLIHGKQRLALKANGDEPIRAAIGSELLIEVTASPADARLAHPDATGTTLRVPVREGEQTVELDLVTPTGLTSRYTRRIKLVGLSQSTIDQINAELAGGEVPPDAISLPVAADALAAAVAFGSPEQATAAELSSGTPVEGQPTGEQPPQNGTSTTGDGTGGDGAGDEPPPLVDAVGVLAARYDVTGDELQKLRQVVSAAPPAYRDLVAEYFLRLRERE